MTTMSVAQALAGHAPEGGQVTVKGWVRTRRDSKAGLSFVNVSDGSCFAPIQVVATDALPNYETEVKHLFRPAALRRQPLPAFRHKVEGGITRDGDAPVILVPIRVPDVQEDVRPVGDQ